MTICVRMLARSFVRSLEAPVYCLEAKAKKMQVNSLNERDKLNMVLWTHFELEPLFVCAAATWSRVEHIKR